jgi:20S proteasome subunit alpha 7
MLTKLLKTPGKLKANIWLTQNSTIMGVVCKDGIILGTEKIVSNKMMVSGTDKRIYSVTKNSGSVFNGIIPDGRSMMQRARDEC